MSCHTNKEMLERARALVAAERQRITGLGDVVAAGLKLPGVRHVVKAMIGVDTRKPCGGCKKRQAALNRLVPIGKKAN